MKTEILTERWDLVLDPQLSAVVARRTPVGQPPEAFDLDVKYRGFYPERLSVAELRHISGLFAELVRRVEEITK